MRNATETGLAMRAGALASIILLLTAGCDKNDHDDDHLDDQSGSLLQEELDELVESGLELQLPPPLPEEELELYVMKLERQQLAAQIASEAKRAMAPLAVAAALFAPSGPVDLLLTVMPVHKLGKAVDVARDALQVRKQNRRAKRLIKLHDQLLAELDVDGKEFLRLASHLPPKHLDALRRIHAHTGSASVIRTLMHKHVRNDADIRWIAAKIKAGKLDRAMVRRYTFDADFVREFTEYNANPSWRVLEDVVEGKDVAEGVRDSLASKVVGLLGERAAARRVLEPSFVTRNFGARGPPKLERGVGYRGGSVDIVALGDDKALYIEVKNWSVGTWSNTSSQARLFNQLERHREGIAYLEKGQRWRREGKAVLMVAEDGFMRMKPGERNELRKAIEQKGWTIELIPSDTIESFASLIDRLR